MKNARRTSHAVAGAMAILWGLSFQAEAQTALPGAVGSANFALFNASTENVTLSIVNQGISANVGADARVVARSLPFVFPDGNSTGYYRIRVASASTGNVLCEGVLQMQWTRAGNSLVCAVSPMPSRCQTPYAIQRGSSCLFEMTHR